VGSKTLKLWAAIALASVFEFLGAFFLGGSVTGTIAGSIARTSTFSSTPALFMYGAPPAPWPRPGACAARARWTQQQRPHLLAGPRQGQPGCDLAHHSCPDHAGPGILAAVLTARARSPAAAGMLCAEAGAMVWALFATYCELPISTTHSIGERPGLPARRQPCIAAPPPDRPASGMAAP
jgi:hypothetical protein